MTKRRTSNFERKTVRSEHGAPHYILKFYAIGGEGTSLSMQVGPTREFANADDLKGFMSTLTETARVAARITDDQGRHVRYDDIQGMT